MPSRGTSIPRNLSERNLNNLDPVSSNEEELVVPVAAAPLVLPLPSLPSTNALPGHSTDSAVPLPNSSDPPLTNNMHIPTPSSLAAPLTSNDGAAPLLSSVPCRVVPFDQ